MTHLLRLTQVARAGEPANICYMHPYAIEQVVRAKYRHNDLDGKPVEEGVGTFVIPYSGRTLIVQESPEDVVKMREELIRAEEKEELAKSTMSWKGEVRK